MSEIKVNKLSPRSGTAVTLGDSGDTFTIPSGATLAIAGSVTGFTSAGIDDNATSVAITINSSEQVGIGTTSFDQDAKLVVVGSGNGGSNPSSISANTIATFRRTGGLSHNANISVLSGTTGASILNLGDRDDEDVGRIVYEHSSNYMAFTTNTSEGMRIDSSGNLLIGKTSANTATAGVEALPLGRIGATRSGNITALFNRLSSDGEIVRFQKDGTTVGVIGSQKWGIGTASPDSILNIVTNSASNGDRIRIQDSTYKLDLGVGATSFIQTVGASALKINTNATERMRILSSGNVGIGTSTPDAVLQVGALGQSGSVRGAVAIKTIANYTTFGEAGIYIEEASGSEGYYMGVDVSGGMFFNNSGAAGSTMYLSDDDNVGIGTSSPQNTLHVIKNAISGASYRTNAPLILENNSNTEIQILSANSSDGQLRFGDADANFRGAITYAHSDDSFTIATNGASQVKIHSNGVMSAADGIALGVGTANTASNVLDDYEEGTWTPALDSVNSSNASGQYTKIGNVCTAKFKISSDGSGSDINITGFPFTSGSGFEQQGLSRETQTSGKLYFIRISGGNTVGTIIRYDASNSITSNDTFEGQITYITNT